MRRLKFLALKHVKLTGSYKHLSKELSSLLWIGFPFEAIPADFDPRNLVYLGLWDSKLVRIWEDSNLVLYLRHCTNLQAIPDLPNSLQTLKASYCTALEIMSDFSKMSKMRKLELKDCRNLKDIPNLENSLDNMYSIHMEGCTSLTDTFKENLRTKNAFGGIFLSGNDIPNWLAYVAGEDKTVKFEVPPSTDYIGGLALGIVYSSDNSDSTGYLYIDVVNRTQRTNFRIRTIKATITAFHKNYLWLGNLSNKKLNLKGGDIVLVKAEFYGGYNRIKVNKTGVDIVKWNLSNGLTNWEDYETISYKSNEDIDDDTKLSYRHVFLCYKTPEAWPWHIEGSESNPLPKFFASALKARKNDITVKTLLTIIEGREGTEFSNGNVLIFPQMIKYRGLKESNVDNFIDDVLVNDKPWASGVQEPLTGPHVFICAHMSQNEWNRYRARVLIDKFKEEAELRGLTDQVFVTACSHIGGHKYAGKLMIYSRDSDGSMTCHWYPFVTPFDVAKSLDKHIGKRKITERLWRGQIGASFDEAEKSNDQKLPNGGENKKIKKPQENGNQRGTKRKRECRLGKGEIIERHRRGQTRASSDEAEEINDRELPNGEKKKKIEEKRCYQGANSNGSTCCKEVSLEQNHCSKNWPRRRLYGAGRWSPALILGKAFGKIVWKLSGPRRRARRHLGNPRQFF
ncbi:uncharacterized protein [Malus domestica]|uniref:uncharacterized protein isoform X2 n=1 Tax=Malus domestica TaxID=3750 RepID=UPI003975EC8F